MTFKALAPLFGAALVLAPTLAHAEDDWVTKQSPKSVADTVAALTAAIEKAGAKVVATLDHQANAQSAGMELPATTVVIFGNPKLGTPLMQKNRRIAIDLPQKMLVWDEDGQTMVGYLEPEELAERYDIDDDAEPVEAMEKALDKLSDAAIAK
ncbi:DUF302 domain-containing protein [Aurantimonas sp. C2-6-R+9]|uniref:DUF302 domain-containing protein n=1 Tax=unclassified Aurantimonas TaxID=2638230 RepID=UPI002E1860D0|nr:MULTISPECIES: DUF302 domain-containing protein [unclassified Aurantimonas]MEC5289820.1 DUF302 domain-containing protein [Aurantimonas sp. C2-3-R2]MEC5380039.1 DUF302 domain-containing protein [Aurantimonas sp. C2-6-R+9]MEC5410902.1 DUF302 domain-containing protein [Aurantimonas sp. C2-4-R8]